MLPNIVAIVGPIRSGKTTASKRLVDRFNFRLASNSQLLADILRKLNVPADRTNLKQLGDALFSTLGNDLLAQFRIREGGFPMVVDGVRYLEEVAAYRNQSSFKLLGITASDEARFCRAVALAHERKDVVLTQQQFDGLSRARSEMHVAHLLREADYIINNNSALTDLVDELDTLVETWSIEA